MDLFSITPDLVTPEMTDAAPAAGRRVRQAFGEYSGTGLFHALYLPTDWRPDSKFPVIFEYPANQWVSPDGDACSGKLEDCNLGFGISGGRGFIWVCLPFVDSVAKQQQLRWWGDVNATVAYCKEAARCICRDYGGDENSLILAGLSRGAIACNFIGLHDDDIARLWRGFVAHSHYDGSEHWPECDPASALKRLQRLNGRPQFISHEVSVARTETYVAGTGVQAPFTFVSLPFKNHTDAWVLRDLPERQRLREWVRRLVNGDLPGGAPRVEIT
jgi:hypothetical protein